MTTVADHIAQRIRETGARHAFGIPGGEVLTVMDALARAGIAFHLVKHETAGGFMADAVAQLTRTPGVLVGTIGPGVTNLVTAVAHAYLDRTPMIVLTAAFADVLARKFLALGDEHAPIGAVLLDESAERAAAGPPADNRYVEMLGHLHESV